MKISLNLPTDRVDLAQEFVTAAAIADMAVAAETAGFDSVAVTEHPFPDDEWMAGGGHHALDPMVALACAGAATSTLRLRTNLYILAYRNPFLSAKAVASLDALTGGRVILGVGTGYLVAEFNALGVRFEDRNELTDEAIVAMKRAWSEHGITLRGRGFAVVGNSMLPRPAQQPHPPIWIGGNSRRAIRRAVDLGDGWIPFPNAASAVARRRTPAIETLDDLRAGIAYARTYGQEVGRTAPLGVSFSLGGIEIPTTSRDPLDATLESAVLLADAGVTEFSTSTRRVDTRGEFIEEVARLGRELVRQVAAVQPGTR